MATEEHKLLASNIKLVHKKLREKVLLGEDPNVVWQTHLENDKTLSDYARSMETLACKYWRNQEQSRIDWVCNQIERYFWNSGFQAEEKKDIKLALKHGISMEPLQGDHNFDNLKALDVGSCYNPFKEKFNNLEVLPVDIAPANSEVFKCDFLNVDIAEETVYQEESVICLRRESFNVVIFCLLLEYLPTALQRWVCVRKAVDLLSENGLLCIVTPDSNHMARNSGQLRSWKQGLSLLGLSKVCYEKSKHFHGLVFRKPSTTVQSLITTECHKVVAPLKDDFFYIPQDYTTNVDQPQENFKLSEEEREEIRCIFNDMPCMID